MVSWCAIGRRNAGWTDCRAVKAFLYHAPFGWSPAGTCSTERKKRANCLSVCWMCETIWDFSPRSTIRAINDSWEIFRRHFHMLRSLVPPEFLAVTRRPRHSNKWEHSPSCLVGINTGERGCPPAPQAGKPVLLPARRNEAPNQILDRYDPAKTFLSVQDSSKSESGSAQLLHHPISKLILSGGYNAPDIIVYRFVSILIEQDIEDVNQTIRLSSWCDHGQTIKAGRSAELNCQRDKLACEAP